MYHYRIETRSSMMSIPSFFATKSEALKQFEDTWPIDEMEEIVLFQGNYVPTRFASYSAYGVEYELGRK